MPVIQTMVSEEMPQTKGGGLYLSMIRDLHDNSIVAYKTAAQQTLKILWDNSVDVRNLKENV